jgi:hypothetical protein
VAIHLDAITAPARARARSGKRLASGEAREVDMGARVVMRIAATVLPLCGVAPDAWSDGGPSTVARTDPPVAGPHAGTWALGVRYPWDVDSGSDGVVVGLGGLGLSIGARVTDRVYAGAAAESESMSRVTSAAGEPADFERLRVGGELRWYVADGVAPVPRHDWIGLRYGAESLDRGVTFGRFADATLGTELAFGDVGVTVSLSIGVSRGVPAAAAPAMTTGGVLARVARPAAPEGAVTTSYVGFAIGLVLD